MNYQVKFILIDLFRFNVSTVFRSKNLSNQKVNSSSIIIKKENFPRLNGKRLLRR